MQFKNVYEDDIRADAYAGLEFPGTYYLAYRDLPEIIKNMFKEKKQWTLDAEPDGRRDFYRN